MHIFLTGPKQVGKSTLINGILGAFDGRVGGFRTVRRNTFLPGRFTVHLIPPEGSQEPTQENFLFQCKVPDPDVLGRFDRLGCRALEKRTGADLLLMDELGPHETGAAAFQAAIWNAVEGDVPILGVLQESDAAFLKKIREHPNVYTLRVTEENRDSLRAQIPALVKKLREK